MRGIDKNVFDAEFHKLGAAFDDFHRNCPDREEASKDYERDL